MVWIFAIKVTVWFHCVEWGNSVKPNDTRVDEWNLAEIRLVDPKFSLLRVKVSEISPSESRGISNSFLVYNRGVYFSTKSSFLHRAQVVSSISQQI